MRVKPNIIIRTLKKNNYSVSKTAYLLGVNRVTVYRWIRRSKSIHQGGFGLSERRLYRKSTRPHLVQKKLTTQQEQNIVAIRIRKKYTAEKIKKILALVVCSRTIHRTLKRYNLVEKYSYYRRPRFQNTIHMHVKNTHTVGHLQMDVKYLTPELTGLPWTCFEYAVIDIYSRYKEVVILNHLDEDGAIASLLEIIPKLPFKSLFLQTDNGLEFQTRFRTFVKGLGMEYHYIHKRTPNENAVIERSFRTDQDEFLYRLEMPPQNYDELRIWFANWIREYNYERPHLGINLQTPYEVVANVMSD